MALLTQCGGLQVSPGFLPLVFQDADELTLCSLRISDEERGPVASAFSRSFLLRMSTSFHRRSVSHRRSDLAFFPHDASLVSSSFPIGAPAPAMSFCRFRCLETAFRRVPPLWPDPPHPAPDSPSFWRVFWPQLVPRTFCDRRGPISSPPPVVVDFPCLFTPLFRSFSRRTCCPPSVRDFSSLLERGKSCPLFLSFS